MVATTRRIQGMKAMDSEIIITAAESATRNVSECIRSRLRIGMEAYKYK